MASRTIVFVTRSLRLIVVRTAEQLVLFVRVILDTGENIATIPAILQIQRAVGVPVDACVWHPQVPTVHLRVYAPSGSNHSPSGVRVDEFAHVNALEMDTVTR